MPEYVYIAAEDQFSAPCKIGISRNLDKRMATHNTAYPGEKPLRVMYKMICPNREVARQLEAGTLERLRLQRVRITGEMAHCDPHLVLGCLAFANEALNHAYTEIQQMEMFDEVA